MNKRRLLSLIMALVVWMTSANSGVIVLANEAVQLFTNFFDEAEDNMIDMEFVFNDHEDYPNHEFGNKERPIGNQPAELTVTLDPKYTFGTARDVKIHIDLPFIETDEDGNIYQYYESEFLTDKEDSTDEEEPQVLNYQVSSGSAFFISTGAALDIGTGGAIHVDDRPPLTRQNGVKIENISCDDTWILPTKEDNDIYKGDIVIERLSLEAGSMPSFTIALDFYGEMPENTIADVRGWVEYDGFDDEEVHWRTEGDYAEDAIITVVNSKLYWTTNVTTLENYTTVWDRFNYVPFEFEIANKSSTKSPVIDRFSINMALPYKGELYTGYGFIGGMTDLDAYLWENTLTGPLYNWNLKKEDGKKYIGNPDKGGVLIYDVTNDEEYAKHSYKKLPTSEPLEYTYTGAAQLTVRMSREKEKLYSKEAADLDPDKEHMRKFLIYVPFDNRFIKGKLPHTFNMKIQPTVVMGDKDRNILWTKETDSEFTLKPPDLLPMTFEKVTQSEASYYSLEGAYYLQKFYNPSNAPYFNPYIIDTIPKDYDLTKIRYEVDYTAGQPLPELKNYLEIYGSAIDYEIAYQKHKYGTVYKEWFSMSGSDIILKQENGKYIWEFPVGDAIKNRINQLYQTGLYHVEFTRQIQINLKDRIESREMIQGRIGIYGIYRIGGPVKNEAYLYYDFKTHMAPENYFPGDLAYLADYDIRPQTRVYAEAITNVIKPGPIIDVKAINGETKAVGDNLSVTYDGTFGASALSGFRYYLGNTTGAPMLPGTLYATLPVKDPSAMQYSDRTGFIAEQIVISKELWKKAIDMKNSKNIDMIDKIVLIQKESSGVQTSYEIPGSDIVTYAAGKLNQDIVIEKGSVLWPVNPVNGVAVTSPNEVYVHFNQYMANIHFPMNNNLYVSVLGRTTRSGTMTSTANWRCEINGATVLQANGQNSLQVVSPNPTVIVKANNGNGTIGDHLSVPFDGFIDASGNRGFHYYLGNTTISELEYVKLTMNLPFYEPAANAYEKRNGLLAEKIVISKQLWNLGIKDGTYTGTNSIKKIEIYQKNQVGQDIILTITGAEIEAHGKVENGNLIIERDSVLWPESKKIDSPYKMVVSFDTLPSRVTNPLQSNYYIGVLGRTARYGTLASIAELQSELQENTLVKHSDSNSLEVMKPTPTLSVYAMDEKKTLKDKIPVPYDGYKRASGSNGYRFYIGNKSLSNMDNAVLTVRLPVFDRLTPDDRESGFFANQIVVSKKLWEIPQKDNARIINRIEVFSISNGVSKSECTILGADILSQGIDDGKGNIIIKRGTNLWPHDGSDAVPYEMDIHFNTIISNINDAYNQGMYIEILGRTARYNLLKVYATLECNIPESSLLQANGSSNLLVVEPDPEFKVRSVDSQGTIGDYHKVPYDGFKRKYTRNGYRYAIGNKSISSLEDALMTIELPVYEPITADDVRNGFIAEEIVISKDLWGLKESSESPIPKEIIESIKLYIKDVNDNNKEVVAEVITGADIAGITTASGQDIVIKRGESLWQNLEYVHKIEIQFNIFPSGIGDAIKDNIAVSVLGRTARYGILTSNANMICKLSEDQEILLKGYNTLHVTVPDPMIKVVSTDGKNKFGDNLSVPYDGFSRPSSYSGYQYYVTNNTISKMEDASIAIDLPLSYNLAKGETINGLLAEKIVISGELLKLVDDYDKLRGKDIIKEVRIFMESEVGGKRTEILTEQDLASIPINANGDLEIVYGNSPWERLNTKEYAKSVEVDLNVFPSELKEQKAYVAVYGRAACYGKAVSDAEVSYPIRPNNLYLKYASNSLIVAKPVPVFSVSATDGKAKLANNLSVTYDGYFRPSTDSGFYYYIGNNSISQLENSVMTLDLPVYEPTSIEDYRRNGLLTNKLVISKDLWNLEVDDGTGIDKNVIHSIEVIGKNISGNADDRFVVSGSAIVAAFGYRVGQDIVIDRDNALWKAPYPGFVPNKLIVHFNAYPTKISDPVKSKLFIGVLGRTTRYGTLLSSGTLHCDLTWKEKLTVAGNNNLIVEVPKPTVAVKAYDGGITLGDNLEVIYDGDSGPSSNAGYRYYLGNNSISNVDNGEITLELPVYNPSGNMLNKNGLLAEKIVFSENLWKLVLKAKSEGYDLIEEIQLIENNSNGSKTQIISGINLTNTITMVGNQAVIAKGGSLWTTDGSNAVEVQSPSNIVLKLKTFPNNISDPRGSDIFIAVQGRTTRYGTLLSKIEWASDLLHVGKVAGNGQNTLYVEKPKPTVRSYAEYGKYFNQKSTLTSGLSDSYMGWTILPYGRMGTYYFELFNPSTSEIAKGDLTLDFTVKSLVEADSGRGYRMKEFTMTKALLGHMDLDYVVIVDSEGNESVITKQPTGYYFTRNGAHSNNLINASGDVYFTIEEMPTLNNVRKMVFYFNKFNSRVYQDGKNFLITKGYIDNLPFIVSRDSYNNLTSPSTPTNITDARWRTIINESEPVGTWDRTGFQTMAAKIDYNMYSKIGNTAGYTESTTLFNEYEYTNYYGNYENVFMDIGYKSMGSFVSGITQAMEYESNVKMTLNVEFKLPYKDFDLYYIKLNSDIRNYLDKDEAVKIYRQNASGKEELWYTVKKDEWIPNAKDQTGKTETWFRINTLLPTNISTNNLFSSVNIDTKDEDQVHPYYRSPNQNVTLNHSVTRVVFKLHINQKDLDNNGNAIAPDFSVADNLFHLTGRFYKQGGSTYAESSITYDFGEGESKRAGIRPNDILSGETRTVNNMINHYAKNPTYYGAKDRWGTSATKAYFNIHEPFAEVRKGVSNDSGKVPASVTINENTMTTFTAEKEPFLNSSTKFLLGFWNGTDMVGTSASNSKNEWYGKRIFVDELRITDTLPKMKYFAEEFNAYEGFRVDRIKYTKQDKANYSFRDHFVSLEVNTNHFNYYVYTKNDFAGKDITLNIIYPGQGLNPPSQSGIDLTMSSGEFLTDYVLTVKKLNGHGDEASEFTGVSAEDHYYNDLKSSIEVEGTITSIEYEINKVGTEVAYQSGSLGISSRRITDYAKIKAMPPILEGKLEVAHNVNGENQFIYNPRNEKEPNTMEYSFRLSNPVSNTIAPKAEIGQLGVNIPSIPNYQLQEIIIPKEIFEGTDWYMEKFLIGSNDVKSKFQPVGQNYVLDLNHIPYLYEYDTLGYYTYNARGAMNATFRVRNQWDKSSYLQEGKYLTAGSAITLKGTYTKKYKGDITWDNSVSSAGLTEWMYKQTNDSLSTRTTLSAYSNTKNSNPPRVKDIYVSYAHEVKNLVADIDFNVKIGDIYDIHGDNTAIENNYVLPGDQFKVKLTMVNKGNPNNYLDGLTGLEEPVMRYTVPEGVRILNWNCVTADTDLDVSTISCKDITNVASPSAIQIGQNLDVSGKFTKDLVFTSRDKLEEGQKVVLELTLEYTDEKSKNGVSHTLYQGAEISSVAGALTVSGGKTHGFIPFLYGARTDSYITLPTGYKRGKVTINPRELLLTNMTGATKTDDTSAIMVNTQPLSLKVEAAESYRNKADNISEYPVKITVGNIKNHTRHEDTNLQVELILDNGVYNLKGIQLEEWPEINYPAGFTGEYIKPVLYYQMNPGTAWIQVASGGAITVADIYAIKWDYGELPAYDYNNNVFKLDDVLIKGHAYFRSTNPNNDSKAYYLINTVVKSHYTHDQHGYAKPGELAIGKTSSYNYAVYKRRPWIELDNQAFTNEWNAKEQYIPLHSKRKENYRPNEDFWYKITLMNKSRIYGDQDIGTGPLLDTTVIDKVPEYVLPAMGDAGSSSVSGGAIDVVSALASGVLDIAWYDNQGNRKAFTPPKVIVKEVLDHDIGGAMNLTTYPSINAIVNSSVLSKQNSQKIKYNVYEYHFSEELGRDERIEIQYKVTSRIDNLPQMYQIKNGKRDAVYLPRLSEYLKYIHSYWYNGYYYQTVYQYPTQAQSDHLTTKGIDSFTMDGDYLIHDVGVTGKPNYGTPKKDFLNKSATWLPGYDSRDMHYLFGHLASGHNGNLFDYDLKASNIQKAEVIMVSGSNPIYVNSYFPTVSRDMWELILKPRALSLQNLLSTEQNVVWAENRLHLTKAWLYGTTEMIPTNTSNRYELDGNTSQYNQYTYGVERGDIFTARQKAINYGDHHLDGIEIIYVFPRGTEPVMTDNKINMKAYHGVPGSAVQEISDFYYEILQKPGQPATSPFYAPKSLMEALDAGKGTRYASNEKDSIPWVVRVTIREPLTAWFNRNNSLIFAAGGAKGNNMFVDIKVRVTEENANGNWFDEVYISARDTETKYYMQVFSRDYGSPFEEYTYSRGKATYSGRLTAKEVGLNLAKGSASTQDSDFDGVVEEKLYAHSGDMMTVRKPMIRLFADIGSAKTADFYHETQEDMFDLNIHVVNRYEWAENNNYLSEWALHNHQTDGGLKGTYFEPVITNILPYGVVPIDTQGKSLPVDGLGWTDDGSRTIAFTITGIPYHEDKWDVKTEFLTRDENNQPINRYKLTFIPKDYNKLEDRVKVLYNEHLVIRVKAKTVLWPDNTYIDHAGVVRNDRTLNSRWQENRTYASSKLENFFFQIEPAASPYIVGYSRRLGFVDNRPDIQGASDRIKASVLGKISIGTEQERLNIEDYSYRTELLLTIQQKDFNGNGRTTSDSANDKIILKDRYVTNTMKIYTKHPRLVVDKSVARKSTTMRDEDTLSLSYGNELWYNINIKNVPLPVTNANSLASLQNSEATKGSLLSTEINLYDWMPKYVTYEDYQIQYPDPTDHGNYITLDSTQAAAADWLVNATSGPKADSDNFVTMKLKTSPNFMASSSRPKREGDFRSGEQFTLKIKARVTDVGFLDNKLDIPWGKYTNKVYVNTTPYGDIKLRQPEYFTDYVPLISEITNRDDYNLDGDQKDEFATDTASITIKKPKGFIRQDTYQRRKLFTSNGIDNPMFSASHEITFMLDELQSYQADIPELIIEVNGLSEHKYKKKTESNNWTPELNRITTGKWELPAGYNPNDYKIYLYYTLEDTEFDFNSDRSKWLVIDDSGIELDENKSITGLQLLPNMDGMKKIIFVIRSEEPDKNPVPAGIRIDVDANNLKAGKQEVSEVDPAKRNVDGYTDSVYQNTPQITYKAVVQDGLTYQIYSNVSLWGRYAKDRIVMLSKDTAGVHITPSNPVLDIANDIVYFRYNSASKLFQWNSNIAVNPTNSKYIKYKIEFTNVEEKRAVHVKYPADDLNGPVIVDALPSIVSVDKENFRMAVTDDEKAIFDGSYSSNKNLKDNIPKWTWKVIEGADRGEDTPPSTVKFNSVEITPITNISAYRPEELFTRNVIRWKFDGILMAGDTIQIDFLGTVDAYEVDETKSTVNDVYGFNANGTMIVYLDPNANGQKTQAAIDIDDYDLNDNKRVDDRFVKNYSKGIGFVTASDLKKVKTSYTNLDQTGTAPMNVAAASEGTVYTYKSSLINTMDTMRDYKYPVIYDILPYADDENVLGIIKNKQEGYIARDRNSKWAGWFIPESIRLEESGDGSMGVIPASKYQVWIGPFQNNNGTIQLLDKNDLPNVKKRSEVIFYQEMSDSDTFIRQQNFILLSELTNIKSSDPVSYEKLRKGIGAIYVQMKDKNYKLMGQNTLNLFYDLEAPQNIPVLKGKQVGDNYKNYSSWNSFAAYTSTLPTRAGESNASGVYMNAPDGKAYIGNYIWLDKNGNGLQDETDTELGPNGRVLSKITDPSKDPGVNEIKIELITKDGLPVDEHGNALVQKSGDSAYYIAGVDRKTPQVDIFDRELMGGSPVVSTTSSDYGDRKGYYILPNIEPGEYCLRYTFPEEYKYYGLSTLTIHEDVTLQGVKPDGINDSLVFVSSPFKIEANKEDSYYMDFDLGLSMPVSYGGTVWIDEHISEFEKGKNGTMDFPWEEKLEGAVIKLHNEDGSEVLDLLGRKAETKSDKNGKFMFDYILGNQTYYAAVTYSDVIQGYPTPIVKAEPLDYDDDNDLYRTVEGVNRTRVFTASVPMQNGVPIYSDNNKNQYAKVESLGLGIVPLSENMIAGSIWNDENRDGFITDKEWKVENITVTLKRFILWNGIWEEDKGAITKTFTTGKDGSYYFEGLESISEYGAPYGYQITIEDYPDGLTPTYRNSASVDLADDIRNLIDSDIDEKGILFNRYSDYDVTDDQILVFAKIDQGVWISEPKIAAGLNAGFASFDQGNIKGAVVSEYAGTTITEKVAGLKLVLEARERYTTDYYPVMITADGSKVMTYGMDDYATSDKPYIAVTDQFGAYEFSGLPTAQEKTRNLYEYRIVAEKPSFAEWKSNAGYVVTGSALAISEDLILLEENSNAKFGYNLLNAKDSSGNDFYVTYPKPSYIQGIYYSDRNNNQSYDAGEGLKDRKVSLYCYNSTLQKWERTTDLNGIHTLWTKADGSYSFAVKSAEFDLSKNTLMEQKRYKLVFEKTAKEVFLLDGKVKTFSDSGLTEDEKEQLSLDWLKDGVTSDICFGTLSLSDPDYNGRDVVDLSTVESGKQIDCGVIEASDGTITGMIWLDENRDGQRDQTELPAMGRKVYLYQWKDTKWVNVTDRNGNSSVLTNSNGTYKFSVDAAQYQEPSTLLERNKYRIVVEKDSREFFTMPDMGSNNSKFYPLSELPALSGIEVDSPELNQYNYSVVNEDIYLSGLVYSTELGKDIFDRETIIDVNQIDCGLIPHTTKQISGVLWKDGNQNGVFDLGEERVSNKKVSIYIYNKDMELFEPYIDYNGGNYEVMTDAFGQYSFEVDALNYNLNSAYYLGVNQYRIIFEKSEKEEYFTKPFMGEDVTVSSVALTEEELGMTVSGITLDSTKAVTKEIQVVSGSALQIVSGSALYTITSDFIDKGDQNCGITTRPIGTMKGKIWLDKNEDGIQQVDEPALSGEEVYLYLFDEDSKLWKKHADLNGRDTIITEPDGTYEFVVDVAYYDSTKAYYLEQKKYKIISATTYGIGHTKAYEGDDPKLDSDGLLLSELTEEELGRIEGIIETEYMVITKELLFGNRIFDWKLGKDRIDFDSVAILDYIDFGVLELTPPINQDDSTSSTTFIIPEFIPPKTDFIPPSILTPDLEAIINRPKKIHSNLFYSDSGEVSDLSAKDGTLNLDLTVDRDEVTNLTQDSEFTEEASTLEVLEISEAEQNNLMTNTISNQTNENVRGDGSWNIASGQEDTINSSPQEQRSRRDEILASVMVAVAGVVSAGGALGGIHHLLKRRRKFKIK